MVKALFSSDVMKAGTKVVKGTVSGLSGSPLRAICMNSAMSSLRVCAIMNLRIGASAAARALSKSMPFCR